MTTPILLTTGFDDFPGAPENPTAWAMQELAREKWQPNGAVLSTHILPVKYDTWSEVAWPLLIREKPSAVIAFGLSATASGFTLESSARNTVAIDRPDFTGACSTLDCVTQQGPAVYASSLPFPEIKTALRSANLPWAASDNAGNYLCNILFYNLMHAAEHLNLKQAGFIHAPYLSSQIERLTKAGHAVPHGASLSEGDFLRGVKLILQVCANKLNA